jgi:hypothetical protein
MDGGVRNRTETLALKEPCSTFELHPLGSTLTPPRHGVVGLRDRHSVRMDSEHLFVFHRAGEPPDPIVQQRGRPPARSSNTELRLCPRHGRIEFHYVRRGAGRMEWRCKRCVGEAVTRRKQKIKRILVDEAGGRCVQCGYDRCIFNLTFHHLDPATKLFAMSAHTGRSLQAFREEAKKCILLCANCHREAESQRRRRPAARPAVKRSQSGSPPFELQICRKHGWTEFGIYGRKRPRWKCKKCVVNTAVARRRAVKRTLLALGGGRCATCGYATCYEALSFHHVDPARKSFNLSVAASKSRAAYLAELAKCVLVCANCHGEIETGLIACPPAGTKFAGIAQDDQTA